MSSNDKLYSRSNHPALRAQQHQSEDQSIAVFLDGVQVGTLKKDGVNITFTYNDVAKSRGLFISHSMRDLDATYSGKLKELPPFFSNLLPEGKRREALCSSLGISVEDEFELFRVLGSEVIGNTRVFSSINSKALEATIDVELEHLIGMTFAQMLEAASDITSPDYDSYSVPGVQNKVSRIITFVKDAQLGHSFHASILPLVILKLEETQYPAIVSNESFFMDVAGRAGLKTAQHTLVSDSTGAKCLLVERFDRRVIDGELVRVYVEDGCQLLGRAPIEKYSGSFERLSQAVMDAVDNPNLAAEQLFRMYLYSYGVGNGDLHAKNVSVWRNPDNGEVELTPCYDIINTFVYGDKTMALSIEGNKTNISPNKFLAYAERLGLEPGKVAQIADEVSGAIIEAIPSIGDIGFDQHRETVCSKILSQRSGVIKDLAAKATELIPNRGIELA